MPKAARLSSWPFWQSALRNPEQSMDPRWGGLGAGLKPTQQGVALGALGLKAFFLYACASSVITHSGW